MRGAVYGRHPGLAAHGPALAAARWAAQGKDLRYALVTSGEAGIAS